MSDDPHRLLAIARELAEGVSFCVAVTAGEDGDSHARVVQPRPPSRDWTVDFLTNRRSRKVREVERTGRLTLPYQHHADRSYVCLIGSAAVAEDLALKRATWTPAHDRWNQGGPDNPDTVYVRLRTQRIDLWSVVHDVLPEPRGYSAAVLMREGEAWMASSSFDVAAAAPE